MDHAEARTKRLGHSLPSEIVQGDEPVRLLHRPQCRAGVGIDVLIDVGAAQLQDDRSCREFRLETLDRSGAAPGMNGHHHVGRLSIIARYDLHPVPELPQDARPSYRRDAVAGA